jgi:alcohol dehydrogenase
MKAAQISEYGEPDVIKVTTEAEKPILASGQVLVEVRAASLNPFDSMVRSGMFKDSIPLEFPVTLGGDLAGVIAEIGEGVESFMVGDEVYGQANAVAGNSGALAEFAATNAAQVAKKPGSIDFTQAAALPLTGVSALQAITEHINLQSGQKILIQGGSGGIGSLAVQLAKHLGAYVATTVPTEALEFARGLGADEVIDFKTQKFEEIIRDYDAVFDTAGGEVFDKSLHVLKRGGIAVSMVAHADEAVTSELGVTAIYQQTKVTTEKLVRLTELVDSGTLSVHVDKTFMLDDIVQAFKEREGGFVKGKIVITVS